MTRQKLCANHPGHLSAIDHEKSLGDCHFQAHKAVSREEGEEKKRKKEMVGGRVFKGHLTLPSRQIPWRRQG